MQFTRLHLSGFKSFADPVDMPIESGLTGVVGPNGCGKSNVVEALRWVMGENSARRVRGVEMDDVIFNGARGRPARNLAEISLTLDNTERNAPAAFNDGDEVEVTRRIERGEGSTYRINGKDVRARDVKLLFEDMDSGAQTTAIVSQGRIGAIINAKPIERRALLEEAAGVLGFRSRRHEAVLRLRAAETNLERLEDVSAALDDQFQGLQRQMRQAKRYRRLSGDIRKFEAITLHLHWRRAQRAMEQVSQTLQMAKQAVENCNRTAAAAATEQAEAASVLPDLRKRETEAAASLQRLMLAEQALTGEEERFQQDIQTVQGRLRQAAVDLEREQTLEKDAATALERLREERSDLMAGQGKAQKTAQILEQEAVVAAKMVASRQTELESLTERLAMLEARREELERRITENMDRLAHLAQQTEILATEKQQITDLLGDTPDTEPLTQAVTEAEQDEKAAQTALEKAEIARTEAEEQEREGRDRLQRLETQTRQRLEQVERTVREHRQQQEQEAQFPLKQAETDCAALRAEEQALSHLVAAETTEDETENPVSHSLTVTVGYEMALGAALGDDLEASLAKEAPVRWTPQQISRVNLPALPNGVSSLAEHVQAPTELSARLSQIGIVPDEETGRRLQAQLIPGQRLVSRNGGLWRWDGFVRESDAPNAAARQLAQRNRLTEVRTLLTKAERHLVTTRSETEAALSRIQREAEEHLTAEQTQAQQVLEKAQRKLETLRGKANEARQQAASARQAYQDCSARLNTARQQLAEQATQLAEARSRLLALEENTARLSTDRAETEKRLQEAQQALADQDSLEALREESDQARASLAESRAQEAEKRAAFDRFQHQLEAQKKRLAVLMEEESSWRVRAEGAAHRMKDIRQRLSDLQQDKVRLEQKPADITQRRQSLLVAIEEGEANRNQAADELAAAEQRLAQADKAVREAEKALAEARETRVRQEAAEEQTQHVMDSVAERIREKLDCHPNDALAIAEVEVTEKKPLPDMETALQRLERLQRERENMGPVNLRAEQEAGELEHKITELERERQDLLSAIAKLRQGIATLDRESRVRLREAFESVNAHFETLFAALFGGGRASLSLIDDDDPLQAGLDIMASPPGKRLQSLGLLSGGEQALTALALLFAVFQTRPAPICVLDEVDAPLDDVNVGRFCTLLENMASHGQTRFLVVTHHRMTMARMDRLFGVTMMERGVSRLVSVDLSGAVALRDQGRE